MATRTKPRRAPSGPQGRFARVATAPSRVPGLRRRRHEPTGLKKVLGGVRSGVAARKAAPRSKKGAAGGLALVAAAAGVVFKHRGKITQSRHERSATDDVTTAAPATAHGSRSPGR
jgi:hypothetical protein